MCYVCLQKYENKLKNEGVWNYYEDYKITCNKLSYANDLFQKYKLSHQKNYLPELIKHKEKILMRGVDSSLTALLKINRLISC